MKTEIQLTDTEARISSIEDNGGVITVNLEWGGPDDRDVYDFDLARIGDVAAQGANLRTGWVVLEGPCKLEEGDTIPLEPQEPLRITKVSSVFGDRMVEVSHSEGMTRIALDWGHLEDDYSTITDEGYEYIEREVARCTYASGIIWATND